MRLLLFLSTLALWLSAVPARATDPDWWWVAGSAGPAGRLQVYVDRSSVKPASNGRMQAVVFNVNEYPLPDSQVMALNLTLIDCRKRTFTFLSIRTFDAQGKELSSTRYDAVPPSPIRPGSNFDVVRRHLCRDDPLPSFAVSNPVQHAMKTWGRVAKPAEQATAESASGYGTGFFVNAAGDIVTSNHVVAGAKSIVAYSAGGKAHPASIVRASAATDLAVLHVDHKPSHYLTLAPANTAKPGDRVFTFGFPVMEMLGAEPKYTDGAISSLSGIGDEPAFAQISVQVQPGNSGGPLVNEHGAVVGVIAAQAVVEDFVKVSGGAFPQNVNWAVRAEYVSPLIGSQPTSRSLSREEAVALTRRSVVVVFVER